MKFTSGVVLISLALLFTTGCVASKKISFSELSQKNNALIGVNDHRWDGVSVPKGEQGQKCGGKNPHFPSLTFNLKKLSEQFNSKIVGITMSAYDINWRGGHHGKWKYEFDPKLDIYTSPKVPSETTKMPKGVKGIAMHTAKSFPTGYYLAPSSCFVGGGHKYFTDIFFKLENGESIKTTFSQGVY